MRDKVRSAVAAIEPFDALEERHRNDALAWIDSGAELYRVKKPDVPPQHLIYYFAVIDGDWILLVDHRYAQLWLPPGGHVEPGEHPADTVRREIREELGVEAVFLAPSPVFITVTETVGLTAGHTDVSLWYALKGDRGAALDFDRSEFVGIRWFHRSDVPLERADSHLGRFLRKLSLST